MESYRVTGTVCINKRVTVTVAAADEEKARAFATSDALNKHEGAVSFTIETVKSETEIGYDEALATLRRYVRTKDADEYAWENAVDTYLRYKDQLEK
jgi:hypothetical protein